MKTKKNALFMSLSVLLIGFLVSSSYNTFDTKALVEQNNNNYIADSFDRSTWIWNTTEVVSTENTDLSHYPSCAVDSSGNVHVAWFDETDYAGSGTDHDIFYKRWNDSSSSWTTTEVVSTESTSISYYPSLAIDAFGNVHIAWGDATDYAGEGSDEDIFYKRLNVSSYSWTSTEVISTESSSGSYYPSLAVDIFGNIHVAWEDDTSLAGSGLDRDIFYKYWNVTSSSWNYTEVVSTESSDHSNLPSLVVDTSRYVYVAWHDETDHAGAGIDVDIFSKRWDTLSSSWTVTEVVSTESTDTSYSPSLDVDSTGNVHVAWGDYTNYAGAGTDWDVFYKRWDTSTYAWTTTEVVSTESTGDSYRPSLEVDSSGTVHIAWGDGSNYAGAGGTEFDIFYKRLEALSSSWTTTEVVSTESTAESAQPSLAIDILGNIHVVWEDWTDWSDLDILYKISTGTPPAPVLAFIVPNPTETDIVSVTWNSIIGVTTYYLYRSTSFIWSVEGLVPIASGSSNEYIDTLPAEDFYYYVVVAENFVGNSSLSNCQYIEVVLPDLDSPELSIILPNPTELSSITLVWDYIDGATDYYIYRSDSYIWSVESLTPIATENSNSYVDSLPAEGYYFYVIVATDGVINSTHSNCEHILYELPSLDEFVVISSLLLGTFVTLFVVTRFRKKNSKLN